MLTPVPSTLPDSTLSPSDIMAKFSPQSLAGLGRGPFPFGFAGLGCDAYDEDGNCIDAASGSDDGSGVDLSLPITVSPLPTPLPVNSLGVPIVSPGVTPVTTVSGAIPTTYAQCLATATDINQCSPSQFSASSTSTSSSSGGLTNSQLASLASQLAAGASQAAILSQLPAGYSIKNGNIVAPSTSSLLSGSSGTILLLLALGVGVVVMMEAKK